MIILIDRSFLEKLFSHCGIALSEAQADRLDVYAEKLVEWNEKINLTAITKPEEICEKHFLDSVLPFSMWGKFDKNCSLIDVGTGAGFPSVPLKILNDGVKITLLDGLNKRIKFLDELLIAVGADGTTVHGRAEELGKTAEYREKFDLATARAVANLSQLCEFCLPFVKVGGYFAALKGQAGASEAAQAENAVKILGGKIEEIKEYKLPCGDSRALVVIRKVSPTPPKYPRNKGQMTKKPL